MFYLLLSIKNILIKQHKYDEKVAIIQSFYVLIQIMNANGISNSSNIIFTNDDYIFIAKIYSNKSTKKMKNPDLFIDIKDGILISNDKLVNKMNNVEKNTLCVINIKTNEYEMYKL